MHDLPQFWPRYRARYRPDSRPPRAARRLPAATALAATVLAACSAGGQTPGAPTGDAVPRDVREMYDRGLQYLVQAQDANGGWQGGGHQGAGVDGLCLLALLAAGDDPNFGAYALPVRKALRSIIRSQDATTGYFGNSMYHQGFAMLALAEAYGAVDDRQLWAGEAGRNQRSIGAALELAVRCAVTAQKKNPLGGWRYAPEATDADTSVSGAVLVGLLAARNAGIETPDETLDRAVDYFVSMTSATGQVAYASGMGGFDDSLARISIASLVYSIARRNDLPQRDTTLKRLTEQLESEGADHYREYRRYYQAQALFQGDVAAWEKWNRLLIRQLKTSQASDGSFAGQFGPATDTSMTLLALALNYRFLPIYER